jgi:hypothetical protein
MIVALFIAALLLIAFAGCAGSPSTINESGPATTERAGASATTGAGTTGATTSGPNVGVAAASDWVTFSSDYISLQLPDSFKGGDPRDPATLAELDALADRNPDPEMVDVVHRWVEEIRSSVEDGPPSSVSELEMFSEPDAQGRMAQVIVGQVTPHDGWSLQDYVDDFMEMGAEDGVTLAFQTEDRAYFIVPNAGFDPNEKVPQHQVIIMGGDIPYRVFYTFDGPSNPALDEIFRASAKTIRVGPPAS